MTYKTGFSTIIFFLKIVAESQNKEQSKFKNSVAVRTEIQMTLEFRVRNWQKSPCKAKDIYSKTIFQSAFCYMS